MRAPTGPADRCPGPAVRTDDLRRQSPPRQGVVEVLHHSGRGDQEAEAVVTCCRLDDVGEDDPAVSCVPRRHCVEALSVEEDLQQGARGAVLEPAQDRGLTPLPRQRSERPLVDRGGSVAHRGFARAVVAAETRAADQGGDMHLCG